MIRKYNLGIPLFLIVLVAGLILSQPISNAALEPVKDQQAEEQAGESAQVSSFVQTTDSGLRIYSVGQPDAIRAISDPVMISVEDADEEYSPNEFVIGLVIGDDARAYSVPFLSSHEVVNDEVGEIQVAITWCPLCFTAIVYSRDVNGTALDFGVSGSLIHNDLVMFDRQTGSLWSQMLGEAVDGPLTGNKLEFLPALQTTWVEWKSLYPDTLAIRKGYFGEDDPYIGYYFSEDEGVLGETYQDDRLHPKTFVFGVEFENEFVAFPLSALREENVINYSINDVNLLVVFNPKGNAAVAFSREFDGQILSFVETDQPRILKDTQTSSIWNGMTGEAVEGPLMGSQLTHAKSSLSFWFAWKDFYQDTLVYGIDT